MEHKWYVVHTYSNFENKAKRSLEERVKAYGCEDKFSGILVPSEQFVSLVQGKKKTTSRKFFPGYILVRMELTDETWHVVMGTPKVTGFVGGKTAPSTISDDEVEKLKAQIEGRFEGRGLKCEFARGDQVNVIEGPFQNFSGVVGDVRPDKGKVKVLVSIFGRTTPMELNFDQITKK
ncbi:MAG: transcription termination/antitermination factor NusG [Deltaproteobacteria bacterium]|nr:transcription termination/antitermination factor NusG [Deltaproteobacteria bacterium]